MQKKKIIRLILGDQLNYQHSWFQEADNSVLYVMMEVRTETDYTKHHIKKLLGFFAAMREFKDYQVKRGHDFHYISLDQNDNQQDFAENLRTIFEKHKAEKFELMEPDEYRLDEYFKSFISSLNIEAEFVSSEHFLAERLELEKVFGKKEKYLMENFYRHMRKKYMILMDDASKPRAGKWNFDAENRKKLPKKIDIPGSKIFDNDVAEILTMIEAHGIDYMGKFGASQSFEYPITREQALESLDYFLEFLLERFGDYQDAMSTQYEFVFHSKLSFALNTKILSPLEVIKAVEEKFDSSKHIDISQVEGFIRQILGWREFMRSFYWVKMPDFAETNFFDNKNSLPGFYWDADTKMNCLHHCVKNSLDNAYAHHIQRLMVTGNFALLAEVDPDEVDQWYLGIYIDALEWVEITNTRGMSQWADGGGLATKPYISSANYVNKMSDYCKNCHYDYKQKFDSSKDQKPACPFNSFYWYFLDKHRAKLAKNPRMSMIYRVWDKMDEADRTSTLNQAKLYKQDLNSL